MSAIPRCIHRPITLPTPVVAKIYMLQNLKRYSNCPLYSVH